MKISIVTDEISGDPETAFELGVTWGVHDFELRGFGTDRVPLFSAFQKDRLKELLEEFEVRIIAISPGLFKIPYPLGRRQRFSFSTLDYGLHRQWRTARDEVKYHLEELLPLSIEYAQEIGAELIACFSFHRGDEPGGTAPDEVLEAFHQAAERVGRAGLQLLIEVESGFWADTGARTAEMLKAINHPALGVNWDPGNAFAAGDTPYPDGYHSVRDLVRHVHFKDVTHDPQSGYRYALEGQIDWAGQIEALAQDGYEGHISVETHMQPKVHSARVLTERLRRLIEHTGH
jgi:sugar phosphate isomerase/epimerase